MCYKPWRWIICFLLIIDSCISAQLLNTLHFSTLLHISPHYFLEHFEILSRFLTASYAQGPNRSFVLVLVVVVTLKVGGESWAKMFQIEKKMFKGAKNLHGMGHGNKKGFCGTLWYWMALYQLHGFMWPYTAFLPYMASYGLTWSCMALYGLLYFIVFSRGYRSKFIWSCLLIKKYYSFSYVSNFLNILKNDFQIIRLHILQILQTEWNGDGVIKMNRTIGMEALFVRKCLFIFVQSFFSFNYISACFIS